MPASFFIVTPSFNQLAYLKRCVASIRDQAAPGLEIRHVVIDGASTDGTPEWLRAEGIEHISEPDRGMYDALNKGLDHFFTEHRTPNTEHYFAWLNADEQYLPGALTSVASFGRRHPDVGVVCGDALVVDTHGQLITYWKSLPLRRLYLDIGTLYNLTCAIIFRVDIFAEGLRFDPTYRAIADLILMRELLGKKTPNACLTQYVSAYTHADFNISNQPDSQKERLRFLETQNALRLAGARVLRAGERFLRGGRKQSFPLHYELYTDSTTERTPFSSGPVSARWPT